MSGPRTVEAVGWGVTAVLVSGWLALVEVFWLPLRVAGVLVPLSIPAAALGNLLLVGLAHRLSGSKLVAALPALTWLLVALAAMVRRPEGDLVLSGGGALGTITLVFLLVGVLAAAFAAGRVMATRPVPAAAVTPPAEPAGSGSGGAR